MSVSNINSSSVDKIDKSERLQTEVDITMSLDYIVFVNENELTDGDTISQTINDFILGNELSVEKSLVEKAIVDILQPYNLNHEISSINLNIETPIITEGTAERDINDIISNIEKKYYKVNTTVNTKIAKCERITSSKKKSQSTSIKQVPTVLKTESYNVSASTDSTSKISSASDTKISNFDSGAYISASTGPYISASTGPYISASTGPYISASTSSISPNPSLPQNSNYFENGINILAQTVSNADSTFTSLDKVIPLPKDFILDSNNKIHIDPKLPNIGNAKIVTTVSKETAGTVLKKAGTIGTVVTSGITVKEGYNKLQSAKTNEEKGQITGETAGKIVGSIAGGAVGSDLGAQLGGVIVITALGATAAVGVTLSAPAMFLIIGGCTLVGAIVGGAAGDAIGGGIGKASGGTIGKKFDTNANKK